MSDWQNYKTYAEGLAERLRDDEYAALYLEMMLSDEPDLFPKALADLVNARDLSKIASAMQIANDELEAALLEGNTLAFRTFAAIMGVLGFCLKITPGAGVLMEGSEVNKVKQKIKQIGDEQVVVIPQAFHRQRSGKTKRI